MDNNTLISVLIPSYNHENFVQDTIKSIINQTYKNIELIVVDDGSKDNTWAKIQEMESECKDRFVNVHIETKQNEGTCKTFNRLLNLSNGEYVYIIASDDLAKPEAIEKEFNFLNKNPNYALCVGNNEYINSEGKRIYQKQDLQYTTNIEDAAFYTFADLYQLNKQLDFKSSKFGEYDTLYLGNYIPNGYLIRKSIFEKTGLFTPEAPLEDYYLMLQISKYAKMKYIDEILFSYRQHSTNTVNNRDKMLELTTKTLVYEHKLLENIDKDFPNKIVSDVKKYGALYKRKGIPGIIELFKYKIYDTKNSKYILSKMIIKILRIPVYKKFFN